MGLDVHPDTRLRAWDTTAETCSLVLPQQPEATHGWHAEELAGIVTRESMIGVALVDPAAG